MKMMVQQFFFCSKAAKKYSKLLFKFINCKRTVWKCKNQKVLNLLNEAGDSKFVTRKLYIAIDQSNPNYDLGNQIIYSIEVFKIFVNKAMLTF